jgi:histidinol phosphatase-like PHP family hydrolase
MENITPRSPNRREFVKSAILTSASLFVIPSISSCDTKEIDFDIFMDLHVHLSNMLTIEQAVEISRQKEIKFGIVEHPGPEGFLKGDKELKEYIDKLRKYPVFIGIQPIYRNWSKAFSPDLLKKIDYVLMDPQTIPQDDGGYLRIWQLDAYVENKESFMERYMEHSLGILNHEPINIFGWPLSLPSCIGRDYYEVWTRERKQAIIDAAKARNIAFEINDMARVPDEDFIRMAKDQGLKFSFGTDSRNKYAGRLTYGMEMAKKCSLTKDHLYYPGE